MQAAPHPPSFSGEVYRIQEYPSYIVGSINYYCAGAAAAGAAAGGGGGGFRGKFQSPCNGGGV